MYEVMDAHPLSLVVIVSAMMITPWHALATYVFSGASALKGAVTGLVFLVWGAVMTWFCMAGVVGRMGFAGNLVVPVAWFTPSLILIVRRKWFLSAPLDQRWLIGLQVWRVIGGAFLIEMTRGHIPGVFAQPAGWGDLLVGLVALGVVVLYRRKPVPNGAVVLVLALGLADFASAFFFGFTSSEGPQKLFETQNPSQLLMFPTGLIPMYLVPYAIFFHTLSWLSLRTRSGAKPE